jgi:hypothetical protein
MDIRLTAAAAGRYHNIEGVPDGVRRERARRGAQKRADGPHREKKFWSHKKQALVVIGASNGLPSGEGNPDWGADEL